MIKERLQDLREKMKAEGIDAYLVFSDDFHGSEYVGDYFKCREFITGFSGSAGSAVIMQDMAGLWTDGRYFLQAEKQLDTNCYKLFKMGEEGVSSLEGFLQDVLKEGQCVGFDGRTVSGAFVEGLQEMLAGKGISFWTQGDLVGQIWADRPAISKKPVMDYELYSGMMRQVKQAEIRTMMETQNADVLLVSALDDIAWFTDMRGNDVEYSPVFLAYAVVMKDWCIVFGREESFSQEIREILDKFQIKFMPYDGIYDFIHELPKLNLWVDKKRTNYALLKCIPEDVKIIDGDNPIMLRKAIKNDIEIRNERHAHIKDGIAITKFLYWLSQNVGNGDVTEISAAEKLEAFRREQEDYQGPSFAPIFAYGAHGAIVHYSADEESNAVLAGKGLLLLLDTGGHYLDGSTDVTRTVAVGEVTQQQKSHYTAVLKGNLNLSAAKFRYGCSGVNLDYLARQPLWEQGLDYNHGTGHGVGFMLNVHEGPNSIRWQAGKDRENVVLEAGMITSNEPGFYLAGEYGIRLENLILCKEAKKTEYGQFMEFETLTMVPFDRNCINPKEMSVKELALLNAYHQRVFEVLEPHLQPEERLWLKEATGPLSIF